MLKLMSDKPEKPEENTIPAPLRVEDIQKKLLESLPDITGQPSPTDPIISEDDRKLINKASRALETLKIEMKTIIGFTSEYLVEKYGFKTQEQFDRVVGPL